MSEETTWQAPAPRRRRRSNTRPLVAAAVIVAAVAYLFFSAAQSAGVYSLTIAEAQSGAAGTGQVRVTGKVVAGSIEYDAKSMQARFTIADGPSALPVEYEGRVAGCLRQRRGRDRRGSLCQTASPSRPRRSSPNAPRNTRLPTSTRWRSRDNSLERS